MLGDHSPAELAQVALIVGMVGVVIGLAVTVTAIAVLLVYLSRLRALDQGARRSPRRARTDSGSDVDFLELTPRPRSGTSDN